MRTFGFVICAWAADVANLIAVKLITAVAMNRLMKTTMDWSPHEKVLSGIKA